MNLVTACLSAFILTVCCLDPPRRARCPPGMDLRTGVRRDGRFACWPHPGGNPDYDGTHGRPDRSTQASWVLEGRVYCTGRERPTVQDWSTVGCR